MLSTDTIREMPRKPLSKEEKRVGVAAKMSPLLLAELKELARQDRRTVSFMIEDAVRELIERRSRPKPKK